MEKEFSRLESNHEFDRRKHKSTLTMDEISSLPDEILVSILSKLSCIKEAARSSILSHRWENLWIYYQGNLEFDATNKLRNIAKSNWPQIISDHLKSMNQVLRPLLCSSWLFSPLNSLVFRCQYLKTQNIEFDTLVEFLMAKSRIQILEFDMNPMEVVTDFLSFPVEFYDWIKQPRGLHTISALTSLSFNNVSLSDDTVEYFVSNCPLLERLCVRKSDLLSHLRIIGDASLKLKYLKIDGFAGLQSLVVSAPNLLSLDYDGGPVIKLDVSNVPKLVEVCIGDDELMAYMSGSLSTYLAQIHTLKLAFVTLMPLALLPPNNVVFNNLKHLVLRAVILYKEHSLLGFTTSLLQASPMLEKFTLDPNHSFRDDEVELPKMTSPTRKQSSQNQRLKVVELIAFKGVAPEVELLLYFVQNFSSLEQIVIDTTTSTRRFIIETPDVRRYRSQVRKERALQLMKHIPHEVDFLLI